MRNKLVAQLVEIIMFFTDMRFDWELYTPTLYNQSLLSGP